MVDEDEDRQGADGSLYTGLREGVAGGAEPAFFYVSTGPWSLYDMHVEFLELQDFPRGPLFLTDWGRQDRRVMRSGREHKRLTISRLMAAFPDTKFLLIGDSGQHDPETYVEAACQHPGTVVSILIRDVGEHEAERAEELATWHKSLAKKGIDFNFVLDAKVAATVLAKRGMIKRSVKGKVSQAIANPDHWRTRPRVP